MIGLAEQLLELGLVEAAARVEQKAERAVDQRGRGEPLAPPADHVQVQVGDGALGEQRGDARIEVLEGGKEAEIVE